MNLYHKNSLHSLTNYPILEKTSSRSGRVIWITGLSGSGKTTLAIEIRKILLANHIYPVLLDGDDMRHRLFGEIIPEDNYSNESRKTFGKSYSKLSHFLASQGFIVITSVIAMFGEVFSWNKKNLPGYFEIYLKAPLEELQQEDSKGIYSDFEEGTLQNLAGVNLKVDEPKNPDLILEHKSQFSATQKANEVITLLNRMKYFK